MFVSIRFVRMIGSVALVATTAACGSDGGSSDAVATVLNDTALGGQGAGSTIGPDGALYVTKNVDGSLLRIDPATGTAKVVAVGLPKRVIDTGGAMDVAFLDERAYVLVSVAGKNVEGPDVPMGIYALDEDGTFSLVADLGAWSEAHPPADTDWFLSQGVQYSMEAWNGSLVVSDAHHGRLLQVEPSGAVAELLAFESTDAVPTGLAVIDGDLSVATAGPIPHLPETSIIRSVKGDDASSAIGRWDDTYTGDVGLIVDIEPGPGGSMYGLLQGHWGLDPGPENEGLPASENTGVIVQVDDNGEFRIVVDGLNQPTSLAISGDMGYVVTNVGTIVEIEGL